MQDNFHRPDDHEAKMARADLFKCAQYSFKLFKMIREDQELEGWVQAKITKAADYIASVYHYMEYEMKISEYGSAIENSDMYSESIRRAFTQKLTEAKKQAVKAKDAMKKKEKDLDEGWEDMIKANKEKADGKGDMKTGEKKKSSSHGVITKTEKGVVHKAGNKGYGNNWDGETPAAPSKAAKSASEKKSDKEKDIKLPAWKGNVTKHSSNKGAEKDDGTGDIKEGSIQGGVWTGAAPKKGAPNVPVPSPDEGPTSNAKRPLKPGTTPEKAKLDPRYKTDPAFKKEVDTASQIGVKEGKKPDFLDIDKDGNKKEPMKKAVADKKAGPKKGVNPFAKVKETAISGAPQKSGIPTTATTTVPGIRATSADLKKAGASAALGEGKCNHTAKGKTCPVHGLKECGGMYEESDSNPQHSHQFDVTMKHAKNPTVQQRMAAHDIKPGISGYKDRIDLLKDLERTGKLKSKN